MNPLLHIKIERLVKRAQAGDTAAFERLLDETTPMMKRIIGARVDQDIYADTLQGVRERLYKNLHKYKVRGQGHFLAWLAVVTRHVILDAQRRRRVINEHEMRWAETDALAAPSQSPDPLIERLGEAIDRLTPRQREAVVAFYLLGYDCAAIAKHRGVSVRTIHTLLDQARARLRVYLADEVTQGGERK